MTIDVNMQLSHMLANEIGASGDETAILDTIHLSKTCITKDNIGKAILSTFHIEVGNDRIDRAITNLIRNGNIITSSKVLSLSPDMIEEMNRVSRANHEIEQKALAEWCADYAEYSKRTFSPDGIIQIQSLILEFIRMFFLTHGADCYSFITGKKPQDNTKIDLIARDVLQGVPEDFQKEMLLYLIGLFTRELTSVQESFLLVQLKKAVHYLSMVVDTNTISTIFDKLKGVTVYLDTTVLYRLLDLQGRSRYESIHTLIQYCEKVSINLKVLQCTIMEMKRRIRYDARVIEEHPTPVAFSAIGYKCRCEDNYISTFWKEQAETGISAKDFNFRYTNILAHLDAYNIEVDDNKYLYDEKLNQKTIELKNKVREYGSSSDFEKSDSAIEHDAECLAVISSLQRQNAESAIEARTFFLSTDWSLIRLQRYDHEYKAKTDIVALPSQLMQIFCLSTSKVDYYEAFLGLFASSHTAFGTGKLDNSQIQEIMGRIASYSKTPSIAEKILCNQLFQSKFTEQETEDSRNTIIDDAIIEEVEQMEAQLAKKDQLIVQKDIELEEKNRQLSEKNAEAQILKNNNIEKSKNISSLNKKLVEYEKEENEENNELIRYRDIVIKQYKRKKLFFLILIYVIAIVIGAAGLISFLAGLGAIIPFTSKSIEPILLWLKTSTVIDGASNEFIIGIIITIGIALVGAGVAIIKYIPKKVSEYIKNGLYRK